MRNSINELRTKQDSPDYKFHYEPGVFLELVMSRCFELLGRVGVVSLLNAQVNLEGAAGLPTDITQNPLPFPGH